MSSNFTVMRICELCGSEFQAKTTVTRFCSSLCNKRFNKSKIRNQKIWDSNKQTVKKKKENKGVAADKEIFNVEASAYFLGVSTRVIYSAINSGRLEASNFGSRLTRIAREDLLRFKSLHEHKVDPKQKAVERETRLSRSNCYSTDEVLTKYGVSRDRLYVLIKNKKIPKFRDGAFIYVLKTAIDKIFVQKQALTGKFEESGAVKDHYSVPEVMEKFGKKRHQVYDLVCRYGIPKMKDGKEVFLLMSAVDKVFKAKKEEL